MPIPGLPVAAKGPIIPVDPFWNEVSLLVPGLVDTADVSRNRIPATQVGTITVDGTRSVFADGAGSLLSGGTGNFLRYLDSLAFDHPSYCIEGFFYREAGNISNARLFGSDDRNSKTAFLVSGTTLNSFHFTTNVADGVLTQDQFEHVAIQYNGVNRFDVWRNGTHAGNVTDSTGAFDDNGLDLFEVNAGAFAQAFKGNCNFFRCTNAERYTQGVDLTVPTVIPTRGPTRINAVATAPQGGDTANITDKNTATTAQTNTGLSFSSVAAVADRVVFRIDLGQSLPADAIECTGLAMTTGSEGSTGFTLHHSLDGASYTQVGAGENANTTPRDFNRTFTETDVRYIALVYRQADLGAEAIINGLNVRRNGVIIYE